MSKRKLALFLIFVFFFMMPSLAFADDGEDSIKDLGWLAILCGVVGTLPFIGMMKVRKYAVTGGVDEGGYAVQAAIDAGLSSKIVNRIR